MSSESEKFGVVICSGGKWKTNNGILEYMPLQVHKGLLLLPLHVTYSRLLTYVLRKLGLPDSHTDFCLTYKIPSNGDVVELFDNHDVSIFIDMAVQISPDPLRLFVTQTSGNGGNGSGVETERNQQISYLQTDKTQETTVPITNPERVPKNKPILEVGSLVPPPTNKYLGTPNLDEEDSQSGDEDSQSGDENSQSGNEDSQSGDEDSQSGDEHVSFHRGFQRGDSCFGGMPPPVKTSVPFKPTPVSVKPTPYPAMRTPYPAMRTPNPAMRTPYPAMRTPYPAMPTPYHAMPTPYPGMPTPYPGMPTPYPGMPTPYPVMPTPYPVMPPPVPVVASKAPISYQRTSHVKFQQTFNTKEELKRALALKFKEEGFQMKTTQSTPERFEATCLSGKCEWQIKAVIIKYTCSFQVIKFKDRHTCSRTQIRPNHRQVTKKDLGNIVKDVMTKNNKLYRVEDIVQEIQSKYKIDITYSQARSLARELSTGSLEQSFSQLPVYCHNLKKVNPGTMTKIKTDEMGRFELVFIAIGCSIRTFVKHLRPLIILNGAQMSGPFSGTMFLAAGVDGNNQIFPIAFGVGTTKSEDSWTWFLTRLKECIGEMKSLAFVSIIDYSLDLAVKTVFPAAFHGVCCHFGGMRYNIMTNKTAEFMEALSSCAEISSITTLIDYFLGNLLHWFYERRNTGAKLGHTLTPWAESKIAKRFAKSVTWTVHPVANNVYEVSDGGKNGRVDLHEWTCNCRQWQLSGLPCGHVLSVMRWLKRTDYNIMAANCYTTYVYRATYQGRVNPVIHPCKWEGPDEYMIVKPPMATT